MGISIGIVGTGSFAQAFIPLFKAHPWVDRVALCDINPEKLKSSAKSHAISETYSSIDEICKTDLDAVAIITQPWLHAPQAIQALEAGKHVYSAVPIISLTDGDKMLEWCDKLIETVKKTGLQYMMGETSYYQVDAMYCRKKAAEGAFGHFVHAEGEYLHDIDSPFANLRKVAQRRYGKDWDLSKSGDIPMHYPTHSIGGFLSVMNTRITKVACFGQEIPGDDWHRKDTISGNTFGNETALCRLANGATARVCEYRKIGIGGERFRLFGTEGTFTNEVTGMAWCDKKGHEELKIEDMRDPLLEEVEQEFMSLQDTNIYGGHGGSHPFLVHEFVDTVKNNRLSAINAWEAVRYFAPGVMAHKSALKGGELLEVPDWGEAPGGKAIIQDSNIKSQTVK